MQYRASNINRMSGIQTRNALLRFNFIFYDKVEKSLLEATGILSRITQICYSEILFENTLNELDELTSRILEIWHNSYGQNIKPKAHNLLHYSDKKRLLGPLVAAQTAPFEMHHKKLKKIPKGTPQKTCAERHQVAWASEWSGNKIMHDFHYTKPKLMTIDISDEVGNVPQKINFTGEVCEVKGAVAPEPSEKTNSWPTITREPSGITDFCAEPQHILQHSLVH